MPHDTTSDALTPLISEDDQIRYTQHLRHRFIHELTERGMPSDTEDRAVLLKAMADMDRTALGNKKIGSKERTAAADREAAMMTAKLISKFGFASPFEKPVAAETPTQTPEIKEGDLPSIDLVPGETDIGVSKLGFDEFMNKMESGEGD